MKNESLQRFNNDEETEGLRREAEYQNTDCAKLPDDLLGNVTGGSSGDQSESVDSDCIKVGKTETVPPPIPTELMKIMIKLPTYSSEIEDRENP